ncbi:MAG: SHOCT domain-containing protein, partial [Leifsonia sp.]
WTDYYTMYPNDAAAVQRTMMSLSNPPKWVKQDDGRLRWWAGEHWSDSWKDDPDAVVATPVAAVAETPATSAADEIKKLAELHAAGILDDEEFAAAKKKALGI